jgi:PAS domain S-box-containing protein
MEDDPGLGRLFQRSLERAGYAVDLARDGEEGLALCETGRYDVLAVDYKMPVHDGLEVIRILALRGTLPPTIMLTGQGDEAIAVEAMKLGAGEYIVKDLERGYLQLLPSVIERMLHQQRLVDAERRALEALRESEERFRAVAESASDALICCDSHETIFFWSKSAETIFGYTAGEATGEPFAFLVPPRWREAFGRQLQEAASRGPDALARPVELAGIRKDGSEFPAEASFSIWHAGSEIC